MHGLYQGSLPAPPADCIIDKKNPETLAALIRRGDAAIGSIADEIMAGPTWAGTGNMAIVITGDEDGSHSEGPQGCCGSEPGSAANFGGGRIPTIVIANHGPRHIEDAEPYNHYSLLRTTEEAFGIGEYLPVLPAQAAKG